MSCRVLLVMEDVAREEIERTLREKGYELVVTENAPAALEVLYKGNLHCAIIDEAVSSRYGIELARTMRIYNAELGIILLGEDPKELGNRINGVDIWDVLPKTCPVSIMESVGEICEFVNMPSEKAEALTDELAKEATTMRKIGHDALNDTGFYKSIQ
jgi:DNA-binding NtrC family response regulator